MHPTLPAAGEWTRIPARFDRCQGDPAPFAALACRGFSYAFSTAPSFRIPFPRRVDLRFALHLPRELSHPPGVDRALRRDRCRHVTSAGGRCGAFALGSTRREAAGVVWYLHALQSDLASSRRAPLREYLRGWRKVLLACILNAAREAGALALCLPPAAAVFEAVRANPNFPLPVVPALWRQIYDRTAGEFGMALGPAEPAVNIQSLPRRHAYGCGAFFRLSLPAPEARSPDA